MAGQFPGCEHSFGWFPRSVAGWFVPAEWLRHLRHGRECLGVDGDRVHRSPHRMAFTLLPRTFRYSDDPSQDHQGGIVFVCAELLSAL
jgi:hypothetical protein